MPYVETSMIIKADPKSVYDFACDMERFPTFMADVESVTVVERGDDYTITDWVTNIDDTPIIWTEKDTFNADALTIDYQLTEGDLDKFEGVWKFLKNPAGTEVVLTVDFDFGIPHLEELIGPTLSDKVRDNSNMMLTGMKSYFEDN